jgi:hypothetical protein
MARLLLMSWVGLADLELQLLPCPRAKRNNRSKNKRTWFLNILLIWSDIICGVSSCSNRRVHGQRVVVEELPTRAGNRFTRQPRSESQNTFQTPIACTRDATTSPVGIFDKKGSRIRPRGIRGISLAQISIRLGLWCRLKSYQDFLAPISPPRKAIRLVRRTVVSKTLQRPSR